MKETEIIASTAIEAKQEETVSIYLPSDGMGAFLEGCLNGVNFRIPTDTLTEVPARIANVIRESRRELLKGSDAVRAYTVSGGRRIG